MKIKINIKETLERTVEIEAETAEEGLGIIEARYKNEEIVLDYNDFVGVNFEIVE